MTWSGGERGSRAALREPPPGGPGAAFQHLGEGEVLAANPSLARIGTAIRSRSATVSARHSTTRAESTACAVPPFSGILQGEHPGIEKEPTVAVFRQPREPVDVHHREAGPFERLDERVGEPLRELVERHEAARGAGPAASGCRQVSPRLTPPRTMRPGQMGPRWSRIASRIAAALRPVRRRRRDDHVEEPAGPRIVRPGRRSRGGGSHDGRGGSGGRRALRRRRAGSRPRPGSRRQLFAR